MGVQVAVSEISVPESVGFEPVYRAEYASLLRLAVLTGGGV